MSDGATPAPKKEHHIKKAKRMQDELQGLLDSFGVENVEELRQRMSASPEATRPDDVVYEAVADTDDPLSHITAEIDVVYLASLESSIKMVGGKDKWNPPIETIYFKAEGRGPWESCPFESVTGDRVFDLQRNVMFAGWNQFILTRQFCEGLYHDERLSRPQFAIINPEDFKGWGGATNAPTGRKTKLADSDILRETTRLLLQRGRSRTHLNADYEGMEWAFACSNPYSSDPPAGLTQKAFDPIAMAEKMKAAGV